MPTYNRDNHPNLFEVLDEVHDNRLSGVDKLARAFFVALGGLRYNEMPDLPEDGRIKSIHALEDQAAGLAAVVSSYIEDMRIAGVFTPEYDSSTGEWNWATEFISTDPTIPTIS
mgnify:CR=1 FL=1